MSWNQGPWWPMIPQGNAAGTSTTIDASGEYVAFVGNIVIDGQATSKTIDTTGSSSITFSVAGGPVFDNASSVFTIGFQGIDNTTGFPVRPDGSWAARSVVTTAANTTPTLTTTSDFHVAIPTAGTSTFSHGDMVCVVLELTTKAGSDALVVLSSQLPQNAPNVGPAAVTNTSGAPVNIGTSCAPNILITFSDGTLGMIEGTKFIPTGSTGLSLTWNDSSGTDEYGLAFQVPFACSVDALAINMRLVDGTSDFQFDLVSAPTTAVASIISGPITKVAENFGLSGSNTGLCIFTFPPVSLTANVDYGIGVKATGAGNIRFDRQILPTANTRGLIMPNGTTTYSISRNGGSGNYAATATSTTIINPCFVRLSDITTGGSGGNANILRGSTVA